MSNAYCSVSTVFENQQIPAGGTFSYSLTNGNNQDFYAFSVNSVDSTSLTITNGWYSVLDYQGASCTVTNPGPATSFNLVLFTASNSQIDAGAFKFNLKK